MFTGLVEVKGRVKAFDLTQNGAKIVIEASFDDLKKGDSVAINGACTTIIEFDNNSFAVECMNETLKRTNLGLLRVGSVVNLERAMKNNSRFNGHIVTGHIDSCAKLISKRQDGISNIYKFEYDTRYIVQKGSVCVNGISLTVSNVSDNFFEVSIIPHTEDETNLSLLKTSDIVNIEVDILAKYIEKLVNKDKKIDENFLKECGF